MCKRSILWGVAILAFATSAPARISKEREATDLIRHNLDEILLVLRDDGLRAPGSRPERRRRLRAPADRVFDWAEMARRSLGPTWRTLDAGRQRRFVELFTERVADRYMRDLDRFEGDEEVEIAGNEPLGGDLIVHTILVNHDRRRFSIDYYLHRTPAGWRVYDFAIEGTSLVNHYRRTFSRFLAQYSFDQLLRRLPVDDAGRDP
jgi:phospholipid transport system substrate-binding protein